MATATQIPAVRYQTYVYSDGKDWTTSNGVRLIVDETWIPSKEIAYNKIEGVFRTTKPRPAEKGPCSGFQSRLKPISLTVDQVNGLVAKLKKDALDKTI